MLPHSAGLSRVEHLKGARRPFAGSCFFSNGKNPESGGGPLRSSCVGLFHSYTIGDGLIFGFGDGAFGYCIMGGAVRSMSNDRVRLLVGNARQRHELRFVGAVEIHRGVALQTLLDALCSSGQIRARLFRAFLYLFGGLLALLPDSIGIVGAGDAGKSNAQNA